MKILDDVKKKIVSLERTDAAYILAHAAWSACDHRNVAAPGLLEVSGRLDFKNTELFLTLAQITLQQDYSNSDQADMLTWLHNRKFSEYVAAQISEDPADFFS